MESDDKNQQPQLPVAMAAAQAAGRVLLIAKLYRLSRNACFTLAMHYSWVNFICCDEPNANTLYIETIRLGGNVAGIFGQ